MNMKITHIKALNKTRYNIYFSNDTILSCNEELIVAYRLRSDMVIDDLEYAEILEKAVVYDYYSKALNYISKGLKSKFKVYTNLVDKGATKEEASEVVTLLEKKSLISDLVYFKTYSHYSLEQGYGPLYIKMKGLQEQIDSSIISSVLDEISDSEYIPYLDKLINKYLDTKKGKEDKYKFEMKLKNYLYQRGYKFDMINSRVREVLNEDR